MKIKLKYALTMFAIAAFSVLLTGCIYSEVTVNINPDGSGRTHFVVASPKENYQKVGKTPKDFTSKYNEYYEMTFNGKKYLATDFDDAYENPEEINWSSGVGAISQELGYVDLKPAHNGYILNLKLSDKFNADMKPEHILPKFNDITNKKLEGMTLFDLIAQKAEGLHLKATFNMPYDVKQVKGGTAGVTVSGKKITLDYLKMIESGTKEWEFESIKPIVQKTFKDVPKTHKNYDAINSVVQGGIMWTSKDGYFNPNKYITMEDLARIVTSGLGKSIATDKTYAYKNHIKFMQKYNFFLSKAEATSKNWNVPATREQVMYALVYGDNAQMGSNNVDESNIKDWNAIDSRMRDMILWGYITGVIDPEKNETFNPKAKVTRAEIAQILYDMYWTVPKSDVGSDFLNYF